MRVAIVEDEQRLARALQQGLETESHEVEVFGTAHAARKKLEYSGNTYDLILLDLMLPDEDGSSVCSHLRDTGVTSPILVLTARDSTEDKVDLFDRGADDFLTKPFQFDELLARSRALVRRGSRAKHVMKVGDFTITPEQRSVTHGKKQVQLTPREFELFSYLARERGRIVTREELLRQVWKQEDVDETNIVDVHMRNLRKKLGTGYATKPIETIHGVGYTIRG